MFQNKLGECPYLSCGIIYALETKAVLVAKSLSTAMFVRNYMCSKYTDFPLKSVDYAAGNVCTLQLGTFVLFKARQEIHSKV